MGVIIMEKLCIGIVCILTSMAEEPMVGFKEQPNQPFRCCIELVDSVDGDEIPSPILILP